MEKPFFNAIIELDQLPSPDTILFQPLETRERVASIISVSLFFILVTGSFLATTLFLEQPPFPQHIMLKMVMASIAFGLFFIGFEYIAYAFKGYAIREHDIVYKKGVFFKSCTVIPINRVQHMETHRGPLQRYFKLSTLSFFTAGGYTADLKISGLDRQRAEDIRQFVLARIGDSS